MTEISRAPTQRRLVCNGIELCYFEWGHATPDQPTVVLAHATGFHARCWDRVVAALPPQRHVIALDQRGHGRSAKVPPFVWQSFGEDLTAFIAALSLQRVVGVGHSMGGHAMVQAAAAAQARFARLLLVDPVIMDPALHAQLTAHNAFPQQPSDHPTSKRNNQWRSWQEMFERLRPRPSFAVWREEVLEDYCRYGLLPNPDGPDFMLACPPLVEAAVYTGSGGRAIDDLLQRIEVPVVVLRAERRERTTMDFLASPTWPALAQQFKHGRDVYLPQLTHFIPMQEPELVARFIEDQDAAAPDPVTAS
jgi:pimeloyl-ACP methyl ester carboxylesterase